MSHISRQRMERLIKDDILLDLDFSDFDTCIDCIKVNWPPRLGMSRLIDALSYFGLFI